MDSYPNGDANDGQLQIVEAAQQPDSEQILINDFGNPNLQKMVDVVLQAYNHEWVELDKANAPDKELNACQENWMDKVKCAKIEFCCQKLHYFLRAQQLGDLDKFPQE